MREVWAAYAATRGARACYAQTKIPPRESHGLRPLSLQLWAHKAHSTRSPRPKTPHSVMGIVEVKDTEQHCFYRAKLLDVKQDNCLVQYEEAEGSTTRQAQSWVHSKLVRREPPEQSAVRIEQVPLSAASLWADLRQPIVPPGTPPSVSAALPLGCLPPTPA